MKLLYSLAVLFLLIGCSPGTMVKYSVKSDYDEFDGYTKHYTVGNTLGGVGFLNTDFVDLDIQKFIAKDGTALYSLIIYYRADGWLFIQEGESLVMLVDGKRMGFSGEGSMKYRTVVTGSIVNETAWYNVTLSELKAIAAGEEIKVKIIGSNPFLERKFTSKNKEVFRKFVTEYGN